MPTDRFSGLVLGTNLTGTDNADGTITIDATAGTGSDADGWSAAAETWTYASADDPTFTFTAPGDLTGTYNAGMRVKLTQTTAKYFLITAVSHAGGTTTITIYGGTDYDLANAAISNPYYSTGKAPQGFPQDPTKWTVITTSTSLDQQTSPVNGTVYNLGSLTIIIPIGAWDVTLQVLLDFHRSAGGPQLGKIGLSTANNSFSDLQLAGASWAVDSGTPRSIAQVNRERQLVLASKTAYYLVASINTTGGVELNARGDIATTVLRAVSAYL